MVTIHRTVVDGWAHEGVAASGGVGGGQTANQDVVLVLVKDSLIRACGQGIEAGYGYPQVFEIRSVEHIRKSATDSPTNAYACVTYSRLLINICPLSTYLYMVSSMY